MPPLDVLEEHATFEFTLTCPRPAVPSKTREVRHFLENVGHEEEQTQRRANHWLPETSRGGSAVARTMFSTTRITGKSLHNKVSK
jgi:hypothetical protein